GGGPDGDAGGCRPRRDGVRGGRRGALRGPGAGGGGGDGAAGGGGGGLLRRPGEHLLRPLVCRGGGEPPPRRRRAARDGTRRLSPGRRAAPCGEAAHGVERPRL